MQNPAVLQETIVFFHEGKKELAGNPNQQCLRYWAKKGIKLPNGDRPTLEYARLGGSLVTSIEAYRRFLLAINEE